MTFPEKRYQIIHSALKNEIGGKTLQQLLDCIKLEFENNGERRAIGERQLQKDIKFMMEEYLAPIEKYKEKRKWYFYYEDRSYKLAAGKLEPTSLEKNQLLDALRLLEQFNILNPSTELYENVLKINESLSDEDPIIIYETNPFLKGVEHLKPLYAAIKSKKQINIDYQGFDQPQHLIVLDPFLLKEYNKRWYVLGWNDEFKRINTLPLDRILEIKTLEQTAINPRRINFAAEEHFYDVIGVTVTPNLEPILISITLTELQAQYTQNKPLHGSQSKMVIEDKKGFCSIKVIPNYELLTTLWSLGDGLVSVEPPITEIKKLIYQYSTN
ncbi:MAG: putative DNA-binding transcriptional regulator YafY [Vicingaceae bacterium]|jgi:predicted DNA-binding transcriptional regulator YafY